jgi:hypothetical protein
LRIVTAWPLFLTIVLLAISFSPNGPSFSASPPDPNPHAHFQQSNQCPKCHVHDGQKLEPERFTTASIDFCLECHLAEERGRTHPLKVHPGGKFRGMKAPPEYRLGDGEHIICLTCHTAHGPFLSGTRTFAAQTPERLSGESGGTPAYRTYFLRRSDPAGEGMAALCEGCHRVP